MSGTAWVLTRYEWDSASGRETLTFVALADSHIRAYQEAVQLEKDDQSHTAFTITEKTLEDSSTNLFVHRPFHEVLDILPTYNIHEAIILE